MKVKTLLTNEVFEKEWLNKKFNRLTVIAMDKPTSCGTVLLCKCDCGNTKTIHINNILTNRVKSCGCLGKMNTEQRNAYRRSLLNLPPEVKQRVEIQKNKKKTVEEMAEMTKAFSNKNISYDTWIELKHKFKTEYENLDNLDEWGWLRFIRQPEKKLYPNNFSYHRI